MCIEIENYKEQHNNDFSKYFDLKKIDADSEDLLKTFKLDRDVVPIEELAKKMGFIIETLEFSDDDKCLSGIIGIAECFREVFGSDKIILLNKSDTIEHNRFTIAHELAHYIYDYNERIHTDSYVNRYDTKENKSQIEERANRFAASFIMPQDTFKKIFEQNKLLEYDLEKNIKSLSKYFIVPETAVKMRIDELEL